ncbi:MAG: class I SAM-dependent methyltransferase [Magnetospirillum sp.]|nr:class I SAM-dependent methyltransferase [Magnetospirillum sp.]
MDNAPGFYASYASHKRYRTPTVGPKECRRFDADIWQPAGFTAAMSVLELGCGTGAFLDYLRQKGVARVRGIDHDPALAAVVPEGVRAGFSCGDLGQALSDPGLGSFDRVVLLDVLEHFTADEAWRLLDAVRMRLAPGGKVVVKVPNAACPWGLSYQFGDLTHRTAFAPESLRQLADAAGFTAVVHGQRHGSARRRLTDAALHRLLSWALLTPPELWSANMVAVLTPRETRP